LRGVIRKIGTIQRRLAWPLHKDDTLFRSGRPTGLNIYALVSKNIVSISTICFATLLKQHKVSFDEECDQKKLSHLVCEVGSTCGRCWELYIAGITSHQHIILIFGLMQQIQLNCLAVNWILKSIDCSASSILTLLFLLAIYCMWQVKQGILLLVLLSTPSPITSHQYIESTLLSWHLGIW
ncbi:hypothetical protein K438DRAFT_2088629, partial [Mycena galopus ATCC 62051]